MRFLPGWERARRSYIGQSTLLPQCP
jgi:hypothetical protein